MIAKRTSTLILCPALLLVSVVCHLPVLDMRLNVYDEGIILAGAERVVQGDVPYRDFWSMYPPGQFYTLAALFKLFGSSVLVERIYDLVVRSLLAMCAFLVTRKLGLSIGAAIAGWAMALVWTAPTWFAAYPVYVALDTGISVVSLQAILTLADCIGLLLGLAAVKCTVGRRVPYALRGETPRVAC